MADSAVVVTGIYRKIKEVDIVNSGVYRKFKDVPVVVNGVYRECSIKSGMKHKFKLVLDATGYAQYYVDDTLIARRNGGFASTSFTDSETNIQVFDSIGYGNYYGGAYIGPYYTDGVGNTGIKFTLDQPSNAYYGYDPLVAAGFSKISYKGTIKNTLKYYNSYLNLRCRDSVNYKLVEGSSTSWPYITDTDANMQNSTRQFSAEKSFVKYDSRNWSNVGCQIYIGMPSYDGSEFTSGSVEIEVEVEIS